MNSTAVGGANTKIKVKQQQHKQCYESDFEK